MRFSFKPSDKSLFAYLLRSPWWVSFAIAAALSLVARFFLPEKYAFIAGSFAIPFIGIGSFVAWKQLRLPGTKKVSATVETVNAMSWKDFSTRMEQAFQREGYTVNRIDGAADFKLYKAGRITLVSCKRWKAASHGVESLRELENRRDAEEGHEALYVALADVTGNALNFLNTHKRIRLLQDVELTALLRLPRERKTSAQGK